MKEKDWFRPKGYAHFSTKINRSFASSYVSNPEAVSKHAFYPLIHQVISVRKYKKVDTIEGVKRAHSYISMDGEQKRNIKDRKIYYSTHIDSQIYSYYSNIILGRKYEENLSLNKELSKCITAYRRIPDVNNPSKCKSNIHFAKDVFDEIKARGNCVAVAFDISDFFDSLDHIILKQAWCELLNESRLPDDHYNIFKSITNCSYVKLEDVLRQVKINHVNEVYRKGLHYYFKSRIEFKKLIKEKKLIRKHPFKDFSTNTNIGIPQGTPISAFLSNLYLFSFDKKVYDKMIEYNAYYRRYSDDIVIIASESNYKAICLFVIDLIKEKYQLTIQKSKTQSILFKIDYDTGTMSSHEVLDDDSLKDNIPFQYLGFEFDGVKPTIRQASINKFYRSAKYIAYKQVRAAAREKKNKFTNPDIHKRVFKRKLYMKYTHLGHHGRTRNYILYAKEAAEIFKEPAINRQLSKSWKKLNIYLGSKIDGKAIRKFNSPKCNRKA